MSKAWKVGFVFVGIFLAGGVVGGFISLRAAKYFVQKRGTADQFAMVHKGRLNDSLNLNEAQRVKIDRIVDETGEELRKVRKESIKLVQAMEARIALELTGDQKRDFEEMQKRWRERRPPRPTTREEREAGKHEDGKPLNIPGLPAPEKRSP